MSAFDDDDEPLTFNLAQIPKTVMTHKSNLSINTACDYLNINALIYINYHTSVNSCCNQSGTSWPSFSSDCDRAMLGL